MTAQPNMSYMDSPTTLLCMSSQFLNIKTSELDRPIYRIISFERLVDLFRTQKLVLAHPTKWGDPFETHVIGANFKRGNVILDRAHRHVIHGQCWTRKSVSDALWRIYSPEKNAVRIKTTPRLLGQALDGALSRTPRSKWFVGRVTYLPQKDIVGRARDLARKMLDDQTETAAAQSLLFKRNSFSHESEVRALVVDRHNRAKAGLVHLKIDPHEMVQGVLIDSRATSSLVEVYSRHLKVELGFQGRISRSTLYDPPEALVVELGKL